MWKRSRSNSVFYRKERKEREEFTGFLGELCGLRGSMFLQGGKPKTMEIIRANVEHTNQIAPLFDAYRQFYKAPSDLEASRGFIHDRLKNNESVIFLALENDNAVGFVQLYPLFASVALKSLWLLNDIYVHPSARKSGVGEALMHEAEDFAKESEARGLFLRTATDNLPAQRLYERCGWVRDEQFYRYDRIFK